MPASKTNYIVLYKHDSQVYSSSSKEIALSSPPPAGVSLEEKRVFFITYQPDNEVLSVHPVDQEEVLTAEIKWPKKKEKKDDEETPDEA